MIRLSPSIFSLPSLLLAKSTLCSSLPFFLRSRFFSAWSPHVDPAIGASSIDFARPCIRTAALNSTWRVLSQQSLHCSRGQIVHVDVSASQLCGRLQVRQVHVCGRGGGVR
mmetsp:Transcript_19465/g.35125  ORF Transcript_19465/g.35125 Transcript_19465/m.35125 type:complete len:111 (-) Transcript_19465:436-768(-)